MGKSGKYVVSAIDLGTHSVKAAIAEISEDSGINIIGKGSAPSQGMKDGEIVNALELARSVDKACKQAESMAGQYKMKDVFISISGSKIGGEQANAPVIIGSKEPAEVTKHHIDVIKNTVYETTVSMNNVALEIFAYEFELDSNKDIEQPVGMMGRRLMGHCYIVYVDELSIKNLERLMSNTEYKRRIIKPIITPLADGEVVLTDDEKDQGVAIVNIGHGTSDIGIYRGGYLRYIKVLEYGGSEITQDIVTALNIPPDEATRLKEEYGVYTADVVDRKVRSDIIQTRRYGRNTLDKIPRDAFNQVVLARLEETLSLIKETLIRGAMSIGITDQNMDDILKIALPAGVVFTGGTASMTGFIDVADEVMGLPVRIGTPLTQMGGVTLDKPNEATLAGLLKIGTHFMLYGDDYFMGNREPSFLDKIANFILEFFR